MESIREISVFLLEPHFPAQAAAAQHRTMRAGRCSCSGTGGLSVTKRTAPSNMHDSDTQAKTTLRQQPQQLRSAPVLLQESCGCEAQLQPSCTPKTPRSAHSAAAPSAVNVSHFPCSSAQAGCRWGEKDKAGGGGGGWEIKIQHSFLH